MVAGRHHGGWAHLTYGFHTDAGSRLRILTGL
jgi:hypothetical protein